MNVSEERNDAPRKKLRAPNAAHLQSYEGQRGVFSLILTLFSFFLTPHSSFSGKCNFKGWLCDTAPYRELVHATFLGHSTTSFDSMYKNFTDEWTEGVLPLRPLYWDETGYR